MRQVTGLFEDAEGAKRAVDALVEARFPSHDISLLVLDPARGPELGSIEQKTGVAVGIATGAAAGGAVGVTLALTGAIPGLGVAAAGPVLGALQGLTAGTAAGSLVGALAGLGWWKVEADVPADALEHGKVLIGVAVAPARVDEARAVLRGAGASFASAA